LLPPPERLMRSARAVRSKRRRQVGILKAATGVGLKRNTTSCAGLAWDEACLQRYLL
jgi:hypothetical protein